MGDDGGGLSRRRWQTKLSSKARRGFGDEEGGDCSDRGGIIALDDVGDGGRPGRLLLSGRKKRSWRQSELDGEEKIRGGICVEFVSDAWI